MAIRHAPAGGAAQQLPLRRLRRRPRPRQTKTNLVVRRQLFSWQEIESADYPTYVANLRQIGCPEQTIRDIIIADVNALYSRRRATELVTRGTTMVAQPSRTPMSSAPPPRRPANWKTNGAAC